MRKVRSLRGLKIPLRHGIPRTPEFHKAEWSSLKGVRCSAGQYNANDAAMKAGSHHHVRVRRCVTMRSKLGEAAHHAMPV